MNYYCYFFLVELYIYLLDIPFNYLYKFCYNYLLLTGVIKNESYGYYLDIDSYLRDNDLISGVFYF